MATSAAIVLLAILLTRYVLRPPEGLRLAAYANLSIYTISALTFSAATGTAQGGVDALKFFTRGADIDVSTVETLYQANFVYFVSNQLQSILPLDYRSFNVLGALLFSYVGMLLLMARNPVPTRSEIQLWWVLTLMPAYHFWTTPFGKDSMQILFLGLFFYSQAIVPRICAVGLLLLLRPHIALVIALAWAISNLFKKRVTVGRVLILFGSVAIGAFAARYLADRLGGADIYSLLLLFSEYGDDWKHGTLRLNETTFPIGVVEFMFRPYFWEVLSWSQFIAWLDGTLSALFVLIILLATASRARFRTSWLAAVLMIVMLALTNPNVGTAYRKKQPILFLAVATYLSVPRRRAGNWTAQSSRPSSLTDRGQRPELHVPSVDNVL